MNKQQIKTQAEYILKINDKRVFMAIFNTLSSGGLHNLDTVVIKALYEQFARFNN